MAEDADVPPHRDLVIDMARLRLADHDDMFAQIVDQILAAAAHAGISDLGPDQHPRPEAASREFLAVLASLVEDRDGWCILYLENMDEVPRFFARSLNRKLRECRERESTAPDLSRLGFVVTGALSLFELKVEADSAFQQFHVVVLPEYGPDATRAAVERYLHQRHHAAPSGDTLGALAEMTGGEPMFLDAIADAIGLAELPRAPQQLLSDAVDRLARTRDSAVLRDLALDLLVDEQLREQMAKLKKHGSIAAGNPLVDIDRVQVLGLVIKNGSRHAPFRVRNPFVARFLDSHEPHLSCEDSRILSELRARLDAAGDVRAMTELLQRAWRAATTDGPAARIEVALQLRSGELHWLADEAHPGNEPERLCGLAMRRTGRGAAERGRPFLFGDDHHLMVGVPLRSGDARAVITVCVARDFGGRFSEHGLRHWLGFLRLVEPSLLGTALAELGRRALRVGLGAEPPETDASGAVERRAEPPAELVLLPEHGALLARAGQRTLYRGGMTAGEIQDVNERCLELGARGDGRDAERILGRISEQFSRALQRIEGLEPRLVSGDRHPLVVTTTAAGLQLPVELLHDRTTQSALCLQLPISRRLLDKPRPPLAARGTFARLAQALIGKRHALRALIVASDPRGDLEHVGDEAVAVARRIRSWCDAHEIPASLVILGPNQCTDQEVDQAMSDIGQVHLVHLCGHGHDVPEDGAFVLRKKHGGTAAVPHAKLKLWMDKLAPWLVYMSTCHGGAVAGSHPPIGYAGVLDALTSAGVPYAVAFRSAVSDVRAREFAQSFYDHLWKEPGPLSPALAMLRARQHACAEGSLAWAFSLLVTQEP